MSQVKPKKKDNVKVNYLEEEKNLSVDDLKFKLKKIEGYLRKTEQKMKSYENKLEKIRDEAQKNKGKITEILKQKKII